MHHGQVIQTENQYNNNSLNDTIDQLNAINIYRILHIKIAEYIFFSSVHGMFFRIDHKVGHKINLSKFKRIEINQYIYIYNINIYYNKYILYK